MGPLFGLVRVAVIMAMTALGGALFGYGVAQKYYYEEGDKKDEHKETG